MSRWIESHQSIASHPKLFKLAAVSGLSPDVCIAKLHRLWWWSLQYAEDGYLDRYTPEEVCFGIGFQDVEGAKSFYNALKDAKWIDEYNRIHDWMDYAGRYLKSKYHTANPVKYKEILDKWIGTPKGIPLGRAKTKMSKPKGDQPNHTKPTIPNLPNIEGLSLEIWELFCEHRIEKKSPLTEKAATLIGIKLAVWQTEKGFKPDDVLKRSVENGWKGIFELPTNGNDNQGGKNGSHKQLDRPKGSSDYSNIDLGS